MLILVVNAGSSSLKCQIIDMDSKRPVAKALAGRVGADDAFLQVSFMGGEPSEVRVAGKSVVQCLSAFLDILESDPASPLDSLEDIGAVGNRVVAGGEYFQDTALVDDEALAMLKECEILAPLHNPPANACIEMLRERMPRVPQSAVFDTAFHQTIPPAAFMYPLPIEYYDRYRIRKYGAHGTSHRNAVRQAASILGRPMGELNLITCHLGSGSSMTAVQNGKSIETSMGFTPLEGLMMGTRSGSIDPSLVTHLMQVEGLSSDEMDKVLNKRSGLLGISGVSDMIQLLSMADSGDWRAQLAIDMFLHRIRMFIGSYYALLPRLDAVVVTAGIGEGSPELREKIFEPLGHLGMKVDASRNQANGPIISTDDSPVSILVVPSNEELAIAQETFDLLRGK